MVWGLPKMPHTLQGLAPADGLKPRRAKRGCSGTQLTSTKESEGSHGRVLTKKYCTMGKASNQQVLVLSSFCQGALKVCLWIHANGWRVGFLSFYKFTKMMK